MAKKSPRLNDFRSGEMTPGLGARSDLAAYSKGCILMKNCMPLVEGGVERVPGTRFLRTVKQTEEGWGIRITRSGSGSGDVDSNPLGIDCGPTCYTFFADGASIGLTAEAEPDSQFVGWSGDGTGTPIRTVVMNGNKVVNAEFSSVYLIGWYKFDEGGGEVARNSCKEYSYTGIPPLPDLAVVDENGDFWSYLSGFATSQDDPEDSNPEQYAWTQLPSPRTFTDETFFGMFFRRRVGAKHVHWTTIVSFAKTNIMGDDRNQRFICPWDSGGAEADPNYRLRCNMATGGVTLSELITNGLWYFMFTYFQSGVGDRLVIVKPDGSLLPKVAINLYSLEVNYLFTGKRSTSGGAMSQCSYGDLLVYDELKVGQETWASWYDRLRSRYGMAARSGW